MTNNTDSKNGGNKRWTFYQLFKFNDDKQIEARRRITVGLITLNKGAKVDKGVILAGIDFFNFIDATFECKENADRKSLQIKRIYL
jgi:hypothetical protein